MRPRLRRAGSVRSLTPVELHNVKVRGAPDGPPLVFAHGLGCDQIMWRHVAPAFHDRFRVITFDHVGHGNADRAGFDPRRHRELGGYAEDLLAILDSVDARCVTYVGHSVGAMIGALAAVRAPERFRAMLFVAASPRYLPDEAEDYPGVFTEDQLEELLSAIDRDWERWSTSMTPALLGEDYAENLPAQLTYSFCRTDAEIIRTFARATFLSDHRRLLPEIRQPCLLVQCARDAMAPAAVGEYMAARIPNAELEIIDASGHVPHVTAPHQVRAHLESFLARV